MYNVSNAYKSQMSGAVFKFDLEGRLTNTGAFYADNILAGSLSITNQCSSGDKIIMGSVYAGELRATFVDTNDIVVGDTITVSESMWVDSLDRYETVPLGAFKVAESVRTRSGIEVVAYDYMSKFNKKAELAQVYGTPFEWLRYCCSMCGVTMAQTQAEIEALPNGLASFECYMREDFECTYRDVVSWLAQIIGGFATMDRQGQVKLVSYAMAQTPVYDVRAYSRYNDYSFSLHTTEWDAIKYLYVAGGTEEEETVGTPTSEDTTFDFGYNPFLQNRADASTMLTNLLSVVESMTYVPFKIKVASGAAFDLGDLLTQFGGHAPNPTTSRYIVTCIDWKYNGGTTLSGAGRDVSIGSGGSSGSSQIGGGGGGGGGGTFVNLTESEYSALPTSQKMDESVLYMIAESATDVNVSQASSNVNVKHEAAMTVTSSEQSSVVRWHSGSYIGCEIDILGAIDVTNVSKIQYNLTTGTCYGHNNQRVEEQTTTRFQCQIGVASSLPAGSNWMSDNMGLYQVYNTHKYTNTSYTVEQCTLDVSNITGTVYIVMNCHGWNLIVSDIKCIKSLNNQKYIKYKDITYANYSDGGAGGVDYSTTEHLTGRKWIDGRDIYGKTLVLRENSVNQYTYSGNEYQQVLPANVGWISVPQIYAKRNTGYVDIQNSDMCICVPNPATRNIYFVANSATDVSITIEYTKTS